MAEDTTTNAAPVLRVISGNPSEEELATILAIVSARGGARPAKPQAFSLWARKSRMTRPAQRPGYGAWRASMMPR